MATDTDEAPSSPASPRHRGPSGASMRETALVALGLLLLGCAVFGSHVASGGVYSDDWPNAALYHFEAPPGLFGALDHAVGRRFFDYRPVSALAIAAAQGVLGLHPVAQLALALALGVLVSVCFFLLLRELGIPLGHAGAISALILIFPWSDATRLWPTASLNGVAVCLWAVGAVLALRGLERTGRPALLRHAAAATLYVVAILTYEVAAGPVLASVLLYRLRSGWPAALRRSVLDWVVAGATLAVMAVNTPRTPQPFDRQLEHLGRIADEALRLLARAAEPFGEPAPALVLASMLVVVAAGVAAAGRAAAHDPRRAPLVRWLVAAAMATVGLVASYVLIVPADPFFSPLTPGVINRVNLFAALPLATLVYATLAIAGAVVGRVARAETAWSAAVTGVLVLAIAIGYVIRVESDKRDWKRSSEIQAQVLASFEQLGERLPSGATVYAFGAPIYAAPGVPVFRHLDLAAAVRLERGDPTISAYPMYPGIVFVCGPSAMYPASDGYGLRDASVAPNRFRVQALAPYGTAFFLQVQDGRLERIDSRSECFAARARYEPGPSLAAGVDR